MSKSTTWHIAPIMVFFWGVPVWVKLPYGYFQMKAIALILQQKNLPSRRNHLCKFKSRRSLCIPFNLIKRAPMPLSLEKTDCFILPPLLSYYRHQNHPTKQLNMFGKILPFEKFKSIRITSTYWTTNAIQSIDCKFRHGKQCTAIHWMIAIKRMKTIRRGTWQWPRYRSFQLHPIRSNHLRHACW